MSRRNPMVCMACLNYEHSRCQDELDCICVVCYRSPLRGEQCPTCSGEGVIGGLAIGYDPDVECVSEACGRCGGSGVVPIPRDRPEYPSLATAVVEGAAIEASARPTRCVYCDGQGNSKAGGACGFCDKGVPLDTPADWDRTWGSAALTGFGGWAACPESLGEDIT